MKEHKHLFSVGHMAKVLGVSKAGFYIFLNRTPSQREQENTRLSAKLKVAHEDSRRTYGYRRLRKELAEQGEYVGKKRLIRLMKANGIVAKRKKPFRVTTQSDHNHVVFSNKLNRKFVANGPNEKWVSDISYIQTSTGFLYLAVIIDLFSRMVIGMKTSSSLDRHLVLDAFNAACMRRDQTHGVLFHSDQGVQYACDDFVKLAKAHSIEQSMSRKGNCWDNSVAESFFGTLKLELMCDTKFQSKEEAKVAIFEYVEVFYNRKRRHSTLGYLPPLEFEKRYYQQRVAIY